MVKTIPTSNLGLLLNGEQLRISIALRFGCNAVVPSICIDCGHPIKSKAYHPLHCKFSHGRQPRHKSINNILLAALKKVNISSTLEPEGLSNENAIRPDDISLIPWTNGLPLAWDYTCVDFVAKSNLSFFAIEKAEILKKICLPH
ncbi:unnamed protein product [Gordionus sp. m RMFG-2023]